MKSQFELYMSISLSREGNGLMIVLAFVIILIGVVITTRGTEPAEYLSLSVPFSTHGLQIPRLGVGTAGLGTNGDKVTYAALSHGVRLIDTAQAPEWYSEQDVGNGLRNFQRDNSGLNPLSIIIVTKIHPRSFEAVKMEQSIFNSKLAIHGDTNAVLDIVLLHSPSCWPGHCSEEEMSVSWQVAWRNLEDSLASGHLRAIGVSNFDMILIKELHHISVAKVSVIQNWMDPFHQDIAVRKFATDNKIVYMAYSSFGTQWQGKFPDDNPVFSNVVLNRIAYKHDNTTVSAVVLSWLLQSNVIAIPRASRLDHIKQNAAPLEDGLALSALKVFLDAGDMREILLLDGSLGTPWE